MRFQKFWWREWSSVLPPSLYATMDALPPARDRREWHLIPLPDGDNLLLSRVAPSVRFVLEGKNGGGALGGTFPLHGGLSYISNGGWSSRPGAINKLRLELPAVAEVLPFPIVEIHVQRSKWSATWGNYFDLPFVQGEVDRIRPGWELIEHQTFDGEPVYSVGKEAT